MKAIVKEPDALKPTLVRAFPDYAQARDLSYRDSAAGAREALA